MGRQLTDDEKAWIAEMEALAKRMPPSIALTTEGYTVSVICRHGERLLAEREKNGIPWGTKEWNEILLCKIRGLWCGSTMNTISVEGLRPDQIARLEAMRDDMLGWVYIGCAVYIDRDFYLTGQGRTYLIDEAETYQFVHQAQEIVNTIREDDDDREFVIVGIYRKGDKWERGPVGNEHS